MPLCPSRLTEVGVIDMRSYGRQEWYEVSTSWHLAMGTNISEES